ncbi:MAG: ribonuclease PH [Dethiobacteria bacterium]|nr:ribonuclease PH [Bacillota bacterium]NMD33863.1 ribonuclease PH [Bacillota bacterium]HOB29348.1 ribonuclease PH [Bacillota bacterium]HPZ41192.1 ribonuclease PH [Bacillota bacterium]HQD52800.1 ribonuclease PH [Bacillota bacterium]
MRSDGRKPGELRPVKITRSYLKYPEGSALISMGDTVVLCTATLEDSVPSFRKGHGEGWVTAEYAMLPRSTETRSARESRGRINARNLEIQRLIGRSLRGVVDFAAMGERTIWLDCDVIQADGGTRVAAVTGSFVALAEAFLFMREQGLVEMLPLKDYLAAVSVGLVDGALLLDLDYREDVAASVDLNVVMNGSGGMVEIQGTAENGSFNREQLGLFLDLAAAGVEALVEKQREALGEDVVRLIEKAASRGLD